MHGQSTVVLILAVVGAVVHSALDALVRGAVTAAIGACIRHDKILLRERYWRFANAIVCGGEETMCRFFALHGSKKCQPMLGWHAIKHGAGDIGTIPFKEICGKSWRRPDTAAKENGKQRSSRFLL